MAHRTPKLLDARIGVVIEQLDAPVWTSPISGWLAGGAARPLEPGLGEELAAPLLRKLHPLVNEPEADEQPGEEDDAEDEAGEGAAIHAAAAAADEA